MKTNCPRCGNWTVGGANYCHTCAWPLNPALASGPAPGGGFELAAAGAGASGVALPARAGLSLAWQDRLALAFIGGAGASLGVLFAHWEPAVIPLIGLATGTADIAINSLERLFWKAPKPEPETTVKTVLSVEHTERDWTGRLKKLGFYDLPQDIGIEQLQHVAKKCLPMPTGEGRTFSRRMVCQKGVLSQNQFYLLIESWLEMNYAFYRDPLAPTRGIVLTERCHRLLKKALVVGG